MKKTLALLLVCALLPLGAMAEESRQNPAERFADRMNGMVDSLLSKRNSGARRAADLLEQAQSAETAEEAVRLIEQALEAAPDDAETASAAFGLLLEADPEGQYPDALLSALDALLALSGGADAELLCQCIDMAALYGRAEELLEPLAQRYERTGSADYGVAYADALYQSGDPEGMERVLDAADVTGSLSAAYERAALYEAACLWDKALDAYDTVDRLWPDYILGLYGKYEVYKASGDFDRAVRSIDRMLSLGVGDEMWLERARIRLWNLYQPEEALSELDALLKYDPDWSEVKSVRASALMMLDRCDDALAAADALSEENPGYASLLRALALLNASRWDEARETLLALCDDGDYGSLARVYLSLVQYEGFDEAESAQKALGEAFSLGAADLDGYDTYLQLGHYYRRHGELEQAAMAYSCADLFTDDDTSALYFLALTELTSGRGEDAEDTLDLLDKYYPGWYETLLIRMVSQITRGDYAAALETCRAIETKYPFCGEGLQMSKALLLARTGDGEGARAAGEACLAEEANRTPDVWCDWAQTMALLGDEAASQEALAEAEVLIEGESSPYQARQYKISVALTRAQILLNAGGDAEQAVRYLLDAKALGWQAGETLLWPEYPLLSQTPGMDELLDGVDSETEWSYYTQPIIPDAI